MINWKHLVAPTIAVLVLAIVVVAYVHEREDRIRAEVTNSERQNSIKARDKAAAADVETIGRKASKVTRADQVPDALPDVIHLPEAIRQVKAEDVAPAVIPPAVSPEDATKILAGIAARPAPVKAGDLVIPKASAVPFFQQLAQCKQNEILLGACKADLVDVQAQRDAALTAERGGSLITRAKRNAKILGVGAALGGAAVAIATHKGN